MNIGLGVQGIGGMNSFAAGALYFLRKNKIKVNAISMTSGGIGSVFGFLNDDGDYLKKVSMDENHNYKRSFFSREMQGLNIFLQRMLNGLPKVYRNTNFFERMETLKDVDPLDPFGFLNFLMPAKCFESEIPFSAFEGMSTAFQKSNIPIMTNAYNYKTGKTAVIINDASDKYLEGTRFKAGKNKEFEVYKMDANYIKAALQLIQFGLHMDMMDGAYQYNPFIAPLKKNTDIVIICVVPLSSPLKKLENTFDIEDFKLKMMFNNAISSEISNINLINKLIDEKVITDKSFKKINVHIIEPKIHKGFFDYFVEDVYMFQNGYDEAEKIFSKLSVKK
jgi:hypothetical protein